MRLIESILRQIRMFQRINLVVLILLIIVYHLKTKTSIILLNIQCTNLKIFQILLIQKIPLILGIKKDTFLKCLNKKWSDSNGNFIYQCVISFIRLLFIFIIIPYFIYSINLFSSIVNILALFYYCIYHIYNIPIVMNMKFYFFVIIFS